MHKQPSTALNLFYAALLLTSGPRPLLPRCEQYRSVGLSRKENGEADFA
jgi:hypothetical protein